MPPDPPDRDPHSPGDRARDRTTLADDPVAEDRTDAGRARTDREDSMWIRVGPDERGPPVDGEPPGAVQPGPSVAAIESELEPIDLVVEATGTDATGGQRDVQDVVDQYERILAGREVDEPASNPPTDDADGRGFLAAARARLRGLADRVRR